MSLCACDTSPFACFTRIGIPPSFSTSVAVSGSSARWMMVASAAFIVGASRAQSSTAKVARTPPAARTAAWLDALPVARLLSVHAAFSTMMRSCSRPMSATMGPTPISLQISSRMLASRLEQFIRQMMALFTTAGVAWSQSRRNTRGVTPLCSRRAVHSPMLELHNLLMDWTASTCASMCAGPRAVTKAASPPACTTSLFSS
mmetsp:Transcript_37872/g.63694  ORF Transcript_37872/g.63694 Transcript_37872/m.63694 type:complete len:202 (-) Transcript_37872:4949-5554(-)